MKRLLFMAMAALLVGSACAGDSGPEPAAFGDSQPLCETVPITVPGITILGQRVKRVSDVEVCVKSQLAADALPTVHDQPECGTPCFTLELRNLTAKADVGVTVTYRQEDEVHEIDYTPDPVNAGQESQRMCVVGVGSPDPCADRITSPKELDAASAKRAVSLKWKASVDTGGAPLAGYEIWRSETGEVGTFSLLTTTASSATQFSDTAVVRAQEYWYFVVAFDGDGNRSVQSNVDSAKAR